MILLCVLIFAGEYFIPEDPNARILKTMDNGLQMNLWFSYDGKIRTGRRYTYKGTSSSLGAFEDSLYTYDLYMYAGPSRHYTIIFCTFIYCQSFNELNARKINEELNIFEGAHDPMFLIIWIGTVTVTAILV